MTAKQRMGEWVWRWIYIQRAKKLARLMRLWGWDVGVAIGYERGWIATHSDRNRKLRLVHDRRDRFFSIPVEDGTASREDVVA